MRNELVKGSSLLILICFLLLAGCVSQPSPAPGEIQITSNPQYDAQMAKRIAKQWHELFNTAALDFSTGSVQVAFVLYADGSVSDIHITANTAGYVPGWICVEAILKCEPFPKWSPAMIKQLGKNHCDAGFTFNYQGQ